MINYNQRKAGLLFIILFGMILTSCKKEEVPALTTVTLTNILGTSATSGGTITSEGSSTILSRGVCWSIGTTPTLADNKTSDGAGAGSFTSNLTGLSGATVYYARAYATNSVGTGYGMTMSFTTLGQPPTPTGATATNITVTSATLNGSVNSNYLSTVVTFEFGTTTSYGSTATAIQSPITGNTVTNVSADITGLSAGTIYHYRIKAVNSLGTTYGNDITFTTLGQVPTVSTIVSTNVLTTSASISGSVNANYLSSVVTFEYGTTTNYGSTVTSAQSPVSGNSVTNVSANLTSLTAGTIYHYRVKAVNSLGTSNGSDLTFTTLGQVPTVTTLATSSITVTEATMNGSVNANYLSTVVTFEYGTSTSYGSTATATQSPITGSTITNVSASITGLTLGTTYHYRVKAVNSLGTSYGNDTPFTTTTSSTTVTDVDGNIYNIVTIGSQVWMKENLKTTKYSDGTAIPLVNTNATWGALTNLSKAYCWANDNPANKDIFGALYTWAAAMNGAASSTTNPSTVQGVCPTGWHLPSDDEWTQMYNFLITNGYNYDGTTFTNKIAKSFGATTGWQSTSATGSAGSTDYPTKRNASGFSALPGGQRYNTGTFDFVGTIFGFWWSATEFDSTQAWYRYLYYSDTGAGRLYTNEIKKGGYSVRCLKN